MGINARAHVAQTAQLQLLQILAGQGFLFHIIIHGDSQSPLSRQKLKRFPNVSRYRAKNAHWSPHRLRTHGKFYFKQEVLSIAYFCFSGQLNEFALILAL
jgi:hypothetical protein